MFFTLKELVKWLGMTSFEIWTHLFTLLLFSVLSILKHEGVLSQVSWWTIFTPLFAADGLNTYFCVIVFFRQFKESDFRQAGLRLLFSLLCLSLLFIFKFLLCQKLTWNRLMTFTEVIAPLFPLLVILAIKACQV
ncbi:hypothetical protein ACJMK2_038539 [Sinanodonta woodiana]|uniref:Transmembrane protein 203 n=1 Tax=Sinanodonta woodiana TaxID=1069815 RepID=A0ABD3W9A8_SINWO